MHAGFIREIWKVLLLQRFAEAFSNERFKVKISKEFLRIFVECFKPIIDYDCHDDSLFCDVPAKYTEFSALFVYGTVTI